MNKPHPVRQYVIFTLLAVVVAVLVHVLMPSGARRGSGSGDANVYQRVIASGEIRCGYVIYPPGCMKDPNSGKLSGIFVDMLEESARNLGLKVNWVEEVSWGSMIEGLQTDRYDMIGSPVWANSTRAKLTDFSTPLFFSGICVYVRAGDDRFGRDLSAINDASVKIATIDGEMSDIIAQSQFPKAQRVSLPQLSDNSQMLLNVAQGRADLTFVEPYIAELFLKNNSKSLTNITPKRPIRVFPNTMMFRQDQVRFKAMLNVALQELLNGGRIQELFAKYDIPAGSFYPPAYPFQTTVPQDSK